jgi:hypothetical protein
MLFHLQELGSEEMVAYVARPEAEPAAGLPHLRLFPADLAVLHHLQANVDQFLTLGE